LCVREPQASSARAQRPEWLPRAPGLAAFSSMPPERRSRSNWAKAGNAERLGAALKLVHQQQQDASQGSKPLSIRSIAQEAGIPYAVLWRYTTQQASRGSPVSSLFGQGFVAPC